MRLEGLIRDLSKRKILAGYWLVGNPFLVETTVDLLVEGVGSPIDNRTFLTLGSDDLVDMWTALTEYGDGSRRLVVVREADRLWLGDPEEVSARIERLGSWLSDPAVKNVTAVFVDRATRWGKDHKTRPAEARELFVRGTARATWIDSSIPLTRTPRFKRELTDTIAALGGVPDSVALAVLEKARWDVGAAVNSARKLARLRSLGVVPTESTARALTDIGASGAFVTSLLSLDKKTATALVADVTSVRGALLGLERGLTVLSRANAMKKPSDSLMLLSEKLGVSWSSAELASVASAHYGPRAAGRRGRLLLEALSQPPSRTGLLEMVVLAW